MAFTGLDLPDRLHQHRDRQRQRVVQPVAAVVLARDIEPPGRSHTAVARGEMSAEGALIGGGSRRAALARGQPPGQARPQPLSRYWICPS